MTNTFIRRTYYRETISYDQTPTKEEMKLLVEQGFSLDRRNLIWERSASTSQRHPDSELEAVFGLPLATAVAA